MNSRLKVDKVFHLGCFLIKMCQITILNFFTSGWKDEDSDLFWGNKQDENHCEIKPPLTYVHIIVVVIAIFIFLLIKVHYYFYRVQKVVTEIPFWSPITAKRKSLKSPFDLKWLENSDLFQKKKVVWSCNYHWFSFIISNNGFFNLPDSSCAN